MSPDTAVTIQAGDPTVTGAVLAAYTWPRKVKSWVLISRKSALGLLSVNSWKQCEEGMQELRFG